MILLVEDSEDDVFIMKRVMKKMPLIQPMRVVTDGRQALNYLQGAGEFADRVAHPLPSLIFLDLKLPLVHGFDVLAGIMKDPLLRNIPVTILSSSPEEKDRKRAQQLGARTFLVKPPTVEMLQRTFRELLAN